MEQKSLKRTADYELKQFFAEHLNKEESTMVENGFRRDLNAKVMKSFKAVGGKGEEELILCSVIPCKTDEISEVDKMLLPESKTNTYTCAINGQEYTILIDLDPYSMFMNDEKIEPRLSNGNVCNVEEDPHVMTLESKKPSNDEKFKLFSCNVCEEECPCTKKRRRNPYKHLWEIAYECEVCGEKVKSPSLLPSHMKTHNKKLHGCTLCDKMFACKSSVKRHMRSHNIDCEPHFEYEPADLEIYDAYTKVLNLSRDSDSISVENELEENQEESHDQEENQEHLSPDNKSPHLMPDDLKSQVEQQLNNLNEVKRLLLGIKKEKSGHSSKKEKKKRNLAKEREQRLKRRNAAKECQERKEPVQVQERTRETPKRTRKPPVRFNGAIDFIEDEVLSSDEKLPGKELVDGVDDSVIDDVDESKLIKDEADDLEEEAAVVEEEEDPSYGPEGGEESEPSSDPAVAEDSDSSFDPVDFLPKRSRKTVRKPYQCEICQNKYSRRASLKRHYLVHNVDRPYVCDKCDKSFSILSYLTAHRKIHFERKLVKCKICNKEFTRQSNLKAHMILHVDFKPFSCRVCNKRFSHTSNLRRHEILHTGLRLHVCMLCGKGFSLPSGLKEHMVTHSAVTETFRCDLCNKNFKEYKKLRRHIDLHISDKKYMCLVCNRTFHQKTGLKRHLLTHSENARADVGADLQALPKAHRVPVVPVADDTMVPKRITLSHKDIKKIVDAVDEQIHAGDFIKTEVTDFDQQTESQADHNQVQFSDVTKIEVYEPDPSEQTYIDKVVIIESELPEMHATEASEIYVSQDNDKGTQICESDADHKVVINSSLTDKSSTETYVDNKVNEISFKSDEGFVDCSPEKLTHERAPPSLNWIKTETIGNEHSCMRVQSYEAGQSQTTEDNGADNSFIRIQNYRPGPRQTLENRRIDNNFQRIQNYKTGPLQTPVNSSMDNNVHRIQTYKASPIQTLENSSMDNNVQRIQNYKAGSMQTLENSHMDNSVKRIQNYKAGPIQTSVYSSTNNNVQRIQNYKAGPIQTSVYSSTNNNVQRIQNYKAGPIQTAVDNSIDNNVHRIQNYKAGPIQTSVDSSIENNVQRIQNYMAGPIQTSVDSSMDHNIQIIKNYKAGTPQTSVSSSIDNNVQRVQHYMAGPQQTSIDSTLDNDVERIQNYRAFPTRNPESRDMDSSLLRYQNYKAGPTQTSESVSVIQYGYIDSTKAGYPGLIGNHQFYSDKFVRNGNSS